jgi:uncharacterized protein (TIGR00299 family) protein
MKALYYDCFAGISGDMNLAAMIDLGVDPAYVKEELGRLSVNGYEIHIEKGKRREISGTLFRVDDAKNGSAHHHESRTFKDIVGIIEKSDLAGSVKFLSVDIFSRIARVEAKIHGISPETVHFHEVGAVDSIVDIVGAALCLDFIKPDRIISSPVQVGGGYVSCNHGVLPVPAPATAEMLQGIPVRTGLAPFEMTTPTGAAILAATVDEFSEMAQFIPERIGYGLGRRDLEIPNALRIFLGEMENPTDHQKCKEALLIECNIDDMNPEQYGFLIELLFEAGAMDVFLTPIIMKKSRPGVLLSILCNPHLKKTMEGILWQHSTTFGLRCHYVAKSMIRQKFVTMKTEHGEISIKEGYLGKKRIRCKPEYEDCQRLAREKGVSIRDILNGVASGEKVKNEC